MNTILFVALLAAASMIVWAIRTATTKLLQAFGGNNSSTNQNAWQGNRVRPASKPHARA